MGSIAIGITHYRSLEGWPTHPPVIYADITLAADAAGKDLAVPTISDDISRIEASSKRLNSAADQATELIRTIDTILDALGIGIEFEADARFLEGREKDPDDEATTLPTSYWLGYGRDDDGNAGMTVTAYIDESDDDLRQIWVRRLENTNRRIRIAAVPALPGFIKTLGDKIDQAAAELEPQIALLKSACGELEDLKRRLKSG